MENKEFPEGMITKEGNVDFCKAKVSFKVEEFKKWLDANQVNGWVNVDILTSKAGKIYSVKNTYQPKQVEESEVNDDLPF